MKERKLGLFGKMVLTLAVALLAVIVAGGVNVYADGEPMVRVSTAKQLKSAMKNPDVSTIIF